MSTPAQTAAQTKLNNAKTDAERRTAQTELNAANAAAGNSGNDTNEGDRPPAHNPRRDNPDAKPNR